MNQVKNLYLVLPFVVGIISDDQGRVLLGRHKKLKRKPYPGYWDLPGGKVEPGENFEDAIKREISEELCLNVTKAELFDLFHHSGKEILSQCTNLIPGIGICYVLETAGDMVSMEQDAIHYVDKKEFESLKQKTTPWTRYFLNKFFLTNYSS